MEKRFRIGNEAGKVETVIATTQDVDGTNGVTELRTKDGRRVMFRQKDEIYVIRIGMTEKFEEYRKLN